MSSTASPSQVLLMKSRPSHGLPEVDPSTLSNIHHFRLNTSRLLLTVDWENKALHGLVKYDLDIMTHDVTEIILDTSYLDIHRVFWNNAEIKQFSVGKRQGSLGSPLNISLANAVRSEKTNTLSVEFSTTDKCTALQWLTKDQTAGKSAPYLFSQCEPIHARSMFPCFDTPGVKSTFTYLVKSQYPVVTSGNVSQDKPSGSDEEAFLSKGQGTLYPVYQHIPIPSYLVAIASGDIASNDIGPRSKVYTEPCNVSACTYEFEADTENFIKAAEAVVFPYEWKTFNVLVLPPSFPYGGMENPNITFATPTLISGDRQNVDVIAHELAHSWSGNLVTNCSWQHFWLNEGWTVYLERRIIAAVHGEPHRHFSAIIGWKQLQESIQSMGDNAEQYSRLVINLQDGQDPDESYSTVPYEKGFVFLFYLENLLGKSSWDKFIPYYFNKFKGSSLDSYMFRDTLYEFFYDRNDLLDSIDWDTWYFTPGLPPKPHFDTSIADACYGLADRWMEAAKGNGDYSMFSLKDIDGWTSSQAVVFLDTLSDSIEKMDLQVSKPLCVALNTKYALSESNNAEVVSRWYRIATTSKLDSEYKPLAQFLGTVGRMKFVRTGFRQLNSVDRQLALETFKANESFYHPICRSLVQKDLGL